MLLLPGFIDQRCATPKEDAKDPRDQRNLKRGIHATASVLFVVDFITDQQSNKQINK
jgi:hypothetical protein